MHESDCSLLARRVDQNDCGLRQQRVCRDRVYSTVEFVRAVDGGDGRRQRREKDRYEDESTEDTARVEGHRSWLRDGPVSASAATDAKRPGDSTNET
jgi:hypothetical protein